MTLLTRCLFLLLVFTTLNAENSSTTPCKLDAKIIIVRHGEARHNVENVFNSNPNDPNYKPSNLTEEGKKQVQATAKKLLAQGINADNVVAVYVSPLPRTQQTAEILAQNGLFSMDLVKIDPLITERQAGDLEETSFLRVWTTDDNTKHHYESSEDFQARLKKFYQQIQASNPCGNVIVVTHAGVVKRLVALFANRTLANVETAEAFILPLK